MPADLGFIDLALPKAGVPAKEITAGQCYYLVGLKAAQVVATGPWWKRLLSKSSKVIFASDVSIFGANVEVEGIKGLNHVEPITLGPPKQLGLDVNLISLVPALGDGVRVMIELVLDQQNRLHLLENVINGGAFTKAVSLAPAKLAAAKAISAVAMQVVNALLPMKDQETIFRFIKDFNFLTGGFHSGYWAFIGTRDEDYPLSGINSFKLSIDAATGRLMMDGKPLLNYSYIVIETIHLAAKGKDRGQGAPWYGKLREARSLAQMLGDRRGNGEEISAKQQLDTMKQCRQTLQETRTLFDTDFTYVQQEKDAILTAEARACESIIWPGRNPDLRHYGALREHIPVKSGRELATTVQNYEKEVEKTEETLDELSPRLGEDIW